MLKTTRRFAFIAFAALFTFALGSPAAAKDDKFLDSKDAKQPDDPQTFLKNYDKLTKGKEADWVYFPDTFDPKAYKTVTIKSFGVTGGKPSRAKFAAESGQGYLEQWIKRSAKLGWSVVPDGGDLVIDGNIANAWEPSGGARMWGGWMANPGAVQELTAKDKGGKLVFEIRHKSRGSTIEDAVENGLEKIVETLNAGK
jgi:hypothetical protein